MEKFTVVALLMIFSLIVGLVVGALSAMADVNPALCVIAGGGAFGSTFGLGLAVWLAVR
jgi:hypothetical protein